MYVADFETTTTPEDCRVWAWGLYKIGSVGEFEYGNNIETFMQRVKELSKENATIYFHNLKFDGEFIINWLFKNGYDHITDKKEKREASFTTLISDKNQFYAMEVYFKILKQRKTKKIKFLDSLKILPFSVAETAQAFNLPISKLEIDYDKPRPIGYQLTQEEIEYIRHDCEIIARAIKYLLDDGLDRMTTAANALHDYKAMEGKPKFERLYPDPTYYDSDVRQAYRGGYTYVKEEIAGQTILGGIVLDVNSLYPYVMHDCFLPYGEPKFFKGKYKPDKLYDVYVQMISCHFELKRNHLPTVQIKGSSMFVNTEYLTSSNGEDVVMILTNVDLALFLDHYDVTNLEYISGWKWKSSDQLFREYIDKWNAVKVEATKEGNKPRRTLAKLQLNSLYGKFGMNPKTRSKIPYFDKEENHVKYKDGEPEERKPLYIPVATFVTSYARNITIRAAQSVYDRFLYADTDSLHLSGYDLPAALDVDPVRLGAWKHESSFFRAKYLRAKSYIEDESTITRTGFQIDFRADLKVTCAGMPSKLHDQVTFDNFEIGALYPGKLRPIHVPGGIVLEETEFTIRPK